MCPCNIHPVRIVNISITRKFLHITLLCHSPSFIINNMISIAIALFCSVIFIVNI